jgi:hypothetical protein
MTRSEITEGATVTVNHHDGINAYTVTVTVIRTAGTSAIVDDGLGEYIVPLCLLTIITPAEKPEATTTSVAEPAEVAATQPIAIPAAPQYGRTRMSAPEIELVTYAVATTDGQVTRGRGTGRASVRTLTALARRGFADLEVTTRGRRKVVTGAVITGFGARQAQALRARPAPLVLATFAA